MGRRPPGPLPRGAAMSLACLTLHQPWASLIAAGVKTIETRSWSTKHRGRIGIHAGLRVPEPHQGPMFVGEFHVAQGGTWLHGPDHDAPMAFGVLVATAELVDVVPINPQVGHEHEPYDPPDDHIYTTVDGRALYRQQVIGDPSIASNVVGTDLTDQLPLGDYSPGRYAWLLDDVRALAEPVPCRGRQGLWTLPEEVARALR